MKVVVLATISILLFSCSMSDPKEDWLGAWNDALRGIELEFFENGTWSARMNVGGIPIEIPNAGTWSVEDDYYEVRMFDNAEYGIEGWSATGSWEIKGNILTLHRSRDGGTTLLKRI